MAGELLELTPEGLFCPAGVFWVDPWRPVARAVVTHAHADHAIRGCGVYLCAAEGAGVLRRRVGTEAAIEPLTWGETVRRDGVGVSLLPAGHILGSAQVRLERRGEVWVVSGDYKSEPDPTCTPFEPVRCHLFLTESTFGLPIYRWRPQAALCAEIDAWWRANRDAGRASLLAGYALGKAQRLLAGVDPSIGPIYTHGAVEKLTAEYRAAGVELPATTWVSEAPAGTDWRGALIVAPPSALASPWVRRFGELSTGFASGWMRIRGPRRRRAVDRGFALSDHVDWPALLAAIEATGAERVRVTHGYAGPVVRWLGERGLDARAVPTRFEGELDDEADGGADDGEKGGEPQPPGGAG
jgi:putative mRNA 3-end processing factor